MQWISFSAPGTNIYYHPLGLALSATGGWECGFDMEVGDGLSVRPYLALRWSRIGSGMEEQRRVFSNTLAIAFFI